MGRINSRIYILYKVQDIRGFVCLCDRQSYRRIQDWFVWKQTDLSGVVVDDETLVPAVEVFVVVDPDTKLLQHGLVSSLAHCMHGGTHVVQDAHDARRVLGSQSKVISLK